MRKYFLRSTVLCIAMFFIFHTQSSAQVRHGVALSHMNFVGVDGNWPTLVGVKYSFQLPYGMGAEEEEDAPPPPADGEEEGPRWALDANVGVYIPRRMEDLFFDYRLGTFEIELNQKYNLLKKGPVRPYLLFGASVQMYYTTLYDGVLVVDTEPDTAIVIADENFTQFVMGVHANVGIGFDFHIKKYTAFVEAKGAIAGYVADYPNYTPYTSPTTYIGVTYGIRFPGKPKVEEE